MSELVQSKDVTNSQKIEEKEGKDGGGDGWMDGGERIGDRGEERVSWSWEMVERWVGSQMKNLLTEELVPSCDHWTSQSPQLKLFETLLAFAR